MAWEGGLLSRCRCDVHGGGATFRQCLSCVVCRDCVNVIMSEGGDALFSLFVCVKTAHPPALLVF